MQRARTRQLTLALSLILTQVKHEFARSGLVRVKRLAGALSALCTGSSSALSAGKTLPLALAPSPSP